MVCEMFQLMQLLGCIPEGGWRQRVMPRLDAQGHMVVPSCLVGKFCWPSALPILSQSQTHTCDILLDCMPFPVLVFVNVAKWVW